MNHVIATRNTRSYFWLSAAILSTASLLAQAPPIDKNIDLLEQLNLSLQQVVQKVSPAIVQVEVVGYGRPDENDESDDRFLTKTESLGSGVIVDPDGYIITNAHVIEGAKRIRVTTDDSARISRPTNSPMPFIFDASVIGELDDVDLAVLKIEANNLPTLPMAEADSVHPGQLVIAIGNPEGLKNSVSMGVVSAVARQDEPDAPLAYIQTDAAINAGSSGGALVDIHGHLVGITSFTIISDEGSEGLGFAIPARMVQMIYEELRKRGRVEIGEIGINVQRITPTLMSGLHLRRDVGLIVSDVMPGGPGAKAGIQIRDVVIALNGIPIHSLPEYYGLFYGKHAGDQVQLQLLRDGKQVSVDVAVIEGTDRSPSLLKRVDVKRSVITQLGAVCLTLDAQLKGSFPSARSEKGVVVAAKLLHSETQIDLEVGDIIRSVNSHELKTVEQLRTLMEKPKAGDAVVLQIERKGKLQFLSYEVE